MIIFSYVFMLPRLFRPSMAFICGYYLLTATKAGDLIAWAVCADLSTGVAKTTNMSTGPIETRNADLSEFFMVFL